MKRFALLRLARWLSARCRAKDIVRRAFLSFLAWTGALGLVPCWSLALQFKRLGALAPCWCLALAWHLGTLAPWPWCLAGLALGLGVVRRRLVGDS